MQGGVIPVGVPLLSRANDRARELGVDTLNAGPRGGKEKLGHLGLASDGRATQMIFIFGWVALSVLVGVIATLRGRHGLGWIMLSILVSPLIALPALKRCAGKIEPSTSPRYDHPAMHNLRPGV